MAESTLSIIADLVLHCAALDMGGKADTIGYATVDKARRKLTEIVTAWSDYEHVHDDIDQQLRRAIMGNEGVISDV